MRGADAEVSYVRADVRNQDAVRQALANMRSLDVAIGNAGIIASAPFLDEEDLCALVEACAAHAASYPSETIWC